MTTTLLVAEDNDLNRDVLVRRLSRRGYDILEATNGRETLEIVRNQQPDAVVLDLRMPILDGWDAANRLKEDEATADIPIIALTAHALEGDEEKALEAGCDAYQAKPADMDDLVDLIDSLVD